MIKFSSETFIEAENLAEEFKLVKPWNITSNIKRISLEEIDCNTVLIVLR